MRRSRLTSVLAIMGSTLIAFLLISPAASATNGDLGGMMIREACQAAGFNDAVRRSDVWFCTGNKPDQAILLSNVCRWQFSDLVAAGFTVTNNGGRCWTNPSAYSDVGGIAVNQYCNSLGYSDATVGETVASWRCAGHGTSVPIDFHAACRWQYPVWVGRGFSLVSYFNSYGDRFGIKCLALLR
ncbi:hypothetical protein CFP75_30845 [Amycolatopsis alba DSM 44262]|uniref:Uncharacterized protein n=2 Tax=Amycolatopsis alba TaxID=76020 RepID=A0A229RFD1_AMYAL|nr:hypothetical protein CFP75_30845 [Amycolatopsis alba DSM 44262]